VDKRINRIIRRFKAALEKRGINVNRLVLYGSHSIGTAKEYSDIDIVVVSDDFASMELYDRLCVLGHAVADVFEPVEPLPYTVAEYESMGPETFIGQEVKPKGVVIT